MMVFPGITLWTWTPVTALGCLLILAMLLVGLWFLALLALRRQAGRPTASELIREDRSARVVAEVLLLGIAVLVYAIVSGLVTVDGFGPPPVTSTEWAWLPLVGLSPLALWFSLLRRFPRFAGRGREAFVLWAVAVALAFVVVLAVDLLPFRLFDSEPRRWFFLFPPAHVAMWIALLTEIPRSPDQRS